MLMNDVLSWMQRLIETVPEMKEVNLSSVTVQISGISIEIFSNDPTLLSDYQSRWHYLIPNGFPRARIYVLSGVVQPQNIPQFSVSEVSPLEFHETLHKEEMIAIYPNVQGQMQFMDLRKRIAIHLFRCRTELPPSEVSAPLRWPIQWILSQENLRLAHAAAIGIDDKGVVLFGKGGAGKSGTTLAALAVGMSTVGDDFIAIGFDKHPFARAVFNHIKQDRDGISRIPGLSKHLSNEAENWRGKIEFHPGKVFTRALSDAMRIHAAVLPSITNHCTPSIESIKPAEALLALISSNAQNDPSRPDGGLGFFANLLRQVPCYRMHLSNDALENGRTLKDFVSNLG